MIALTYGDSVLWALFGTGCVLCSIAFLDFIGETGRMLLATLAVFAAFIAGVGAIVWWIS